MYMYKCTTSEKHPHPPEKKKNSKEEMKDNSVWIWKSLKLTVQEFSSESAGPSQCNQASPYELP